MSDIFYFLTSKLLLEFVIIINLHHDVSLVGLVAVDSAHK
jgi:hypothetical protein